MIGVSQRVGVAAASPLPALPSRPTDLATPDSRQTRSARDRNVSLAEHDLPALAAPIVSLRIAIDVPALLAHQREDLVPRKQIQLMLRVVNGPKRKPVPIHLNVPSVDHPDPASLRVGVDIQDHVAVVAAISNDRAIPSAGPELQHLAPEKHRLAPKGDKLMRVGPLVTTEVGSLAVTT